MTFSSMIAYDKHQCTNSFNSLMEIVCKNSCITYCISMYLMVGNHFKHNNAWFLINAQFILIALQ